MRTTLSLDEDVARRLERLQRDRETSWRQVVNDVLRQGLATVEAPPKKRRKRYRTKPLSMGRLLIPSLDDVTTALEIAEGERHR